MSPEEIREALAEVDSLGGWVLSNGEGDPSFDAIIEAARLYADLLENGREITVLADHRLTQPLSLWPGRYLVVPVEDDA